MVVQPDETNSIDQRILEYTLWNEHRIPVIRRSLHDIATKSTTDSQHQLIIDTHVAAVIYFRAGYTPRDYKSQHDYDAIYQIECSTAIKCPSIGQHLAGTKKIQQVLAQDGMLERFLSKEKANKLRQCFAGLYALEKDDEEVRSEKMRRVDSFIRTFMHCFHVFTFCLFLTVHLFPPPSSFHPV